MAGTLATIGDEEIGALFEEPEGFRPAAPEPTIHRIARKPALVEPGLSLSLYLSGPLGHWLILSSSWVPIGTPAELVVELVGSHSLWVTVFLV